MRKESRRKLLSVVRTLLRRYTLPSPVALVTHVLVHVVQRGRGTSRRVITVRKVEILEGQKTERQRKRIEDQEKQTKTNLTQENTLKQQDPKPMDFFYNNVLLIVAGTRPVAYNDFSSLTPPQVGNRRHMGVERMANAKYF